MLAWCFVCAVLHVARVDQCVQAAERLQPEVSSGVFVDVEETGPDFDLQGEYVGLLSGGYRRVPIGLQVITRDNNKMHAVEYRGGLPGSGWDHQSRTEMDGTYHGHTAILKGPTRQVIISGRQIRLSDADGILRGILKRVDRQSSTMGASPPPGAIVLFDGGPAEELRGAKITPNGLLEEGTATTRKFTDFFLHIEFRSPYMPRETGQGRGNSGVYIQQRYEVQILDSFGLEGVANECGALYKTIPPSVNMCLPPLTWQTYDIRFRAARFNDKDEKTDDARITVKLNGVVVQDDVAIPNKTGAGRPEGPQPGPILFQDHSDPVRYRNMWILDESQGVSAPGITPEGRLSQPPCLTEIGPSLRVGDVSGGPRGLGLPAVMAPMSGAGVSRVGDLGEFLPVSLRARAPLR
jgi:hypothetical protein